MKSTTNHLLVTTLLVTLATTNIATPNPASFSIVN
jgi:hypothetical protein